MMIDQMHRRRNDSIFKDVDQTFCFEVGEVVLKSCLKFLCGTFYSLLNE